MPVDASLFERDLKLLQERYGKASVHDADKMLPIDRIPVPLPEIMRITSTRDDQGRVVAGIPMGRVTRLWGDASTGKTLLSYIIIAAAQQFRSERFPDGLSCMYHNIEGQFDPVHAASFGVDLDKLKLSHLTLIEDIAGEMDLVLGSIHLHVLDSASFATPMGEIAGPKGSKHPEYDVYSQQGLHARAWKFAINRIHHRMDKEENCLVGNTLVAVADGRNAVSIQDLAKEARDVEVYASDGDQTVVRTMRNVRMTRSNQPIYRVALDDGSVIRCTHDHLFMLRDGTYQRAILLKPGDSLMRFDSDVRNGYREIWMGPRHGKKNALGTTWRLQYRWIGERLYGDARKKKALHHGDLDSLNDYENLVLLTKAEHSRIHREADGLEVLSARMKEVRARETFEVRSARAKKIWADKTPEERSQWGKNTAAAQTPEQLSDRVRKSWETRRANGENPSETIKKGWEKRRVTAQNHKVVSVEFDGVEDVYCGDVDHVHNFAVITSIVDGDARNGRLSGVVVHNCVIVIDHATQDQKTQVERALSGKRMEFRSDLSIHLKKGSHLYYNKHGRLDTWDRISEAEKKDPRGQKSADGTEIKMIVNKSRVCRPLRKGTMRLDLNTMKFDHTWELAEASLTYDEQGELAHRSGRPSLVVQSGSFFRAPGYDKSVQGHAALCKLIEGDPMLQQSIQQTMLKAA